MANRNFTPPQVDNRMLFLDRRAAMRHAIRLLQEAGMQPGNGICTMDASTLSAWLDEMQAAQGWRK